MPKFLALVAWLLLANAAFAASDGDFDVQRYDLALSPDVAAKTLSGREVITLRVTRDGLQRLSFSANTLSIDSASLDGQPATVRATADALEIETPEPLARGRIVTLALAYHGKPARGFAGAETSLYTSYFACDWMICRQDGFGDKARVSLDLRVPAGMDALSVGHRISKRSLADGGEVQRWTTLRAYSPYLFGFAIGRFARVEERVGGARLAYLSDVADAETLKRRFADTGQIVRFFADKAGTPLPVRTYSQLLVAGHEAQEAASYSVIGLDALPAKADAPAEDWAIAHELAHQWWGNLVTCATLRDFWLNEGITTFMTAAWKEHRYGRAAYEAELAVARARLNKARAAGFDKPLAWDGRYPTLGTRRAVQYSKGALFLDHLRVTLGEKAFWAGLRRYTRTHAGGTVTSLDFQRAMEAASGRDLQPLFAEWVFS
jgi:aminopeptidase N